MCREKSLLRNFLLCLTQKNASMVVLCASTFVKALNWSIYCVVVGAVWSIQVALCRSLLLFAKFRQSLLWQRQECKVGCFINSPQFLDNRFYGKPFPLLEKIYVSYNDVMSPTRLFSQRIRNEITGNTIKDSLLHWVTVALDGVGEDSLMRYTGDGIPYLHLEIFVDTEMAKITSYVYIYRPGSPEPMRLQPRHPFLKLFAVGEEDLCARVREEGLRPEWDGDARLQSHSDSQKGTLTIAQAYDETLAFSSGFLVVRS